MSDFTLFERLVLQGLLEGDHAVLAVLRHQLASATVSERSFTTPGCFVDIEVDPRADRVQPSSFHISDVDLALETCEHGAAAILFVRNGCISLLEMVAYTDDWPKSPSLRHLSYLSPHGPRPTRDMETFVSSLEPGHKTTLRG